MHPDVQINIEFVLEGRFLPIFSAVPSSNIGRIGILVYSLERFYCYLDFVYNNHHDAKSR